VWTYDDVFTPEDMARDPYYQDFLGKHGLGRFLAQLATPMPGYVASISVQRDVRLGPFEKHEMERFELLGRHAARALATTTKLAEGRRLNADLSLVIERLDCGLIILDQHGTVTFVNDVAQRRLGDGVNVRHRRVRTANPSEQGDLDQLIASALPLAPCPPHGPVALTRRSGRRTLFVQAMPVRWNAADRLDHLSLGHGGVLLLLNDIECPSAKGVADSLIILGLTRGEARLAELVGSGIPPREAAERLGITEATARTVLKQVFLKLDIGRQSELAVVVTKLQVLAT
jgi:DNA-binding CsgD family transcriptional regulator